MYLCLELFEDNFQPKANRSLKYIHSYRWQLTAIKFKLHDVRVILSKSYSHLVKAYSSLVKAKSLKPCARGRFQNLT